MERMNFKSNQRIWRELKSSYTLEDQECSDVMERISLLVHGIAALIATCHFTYSDEQISRMVEVTIQDMVRGIV